MSQEQMVVSHAKHKASIEKMMLEMPKVSQSRENVGKWPLPINGTKRQTIATNFGKILVA